MSARLARIVVLAIAVLLVACGTDTPTAPEQPAARANSMPGTLDGATCALIQEDVEFGSWKHRSGTHDCLRGLAYEDWPKARTEAAHIAQWDLGGADLNELINSLMRFDSAEAVGATLQAYGLLNGDGDPDAVGYRGEDWKPLTGSDWLLKAGNQLWFDAETGTHPNQHDALLYELADLFGDAFAGAEFSETAPHWDSEDPYQLRASIGDRNWDRQADNYGDWYDVGAVLELINDMAVDIGISKRAIALETYDQTVRVVVGPGESLIAAAADGLIFPVAASSSMDRGKAFEDEIRRLYRIDAD